MVTRQSANSRQPLDRFQCFCTLQPYDLAFDLNAMSPLGHSKVIPYTKFEVFAIIHF